MIYSGIKKAFIFWGFLPPKVRTLYCTYTIKPGRYISTKTYPFWTAAQCTDVHFASFHSSVFTTITVINPPERKLAKRISVRWVGLTIFFFKVFFRLRIFFFRNKKFFFKEQLWFSFLCIVKQKKILSDLKFFEIFPFSKITK